ncbi:hypothetical protein FGIG_07496 [Fasciola gigantica]|uniref:Uncharacterized protein n=1 Tax=Fasciola gigantica TaxID=46835 RepID=A0A504YI57_FASGI|nr:hypothetical protein FGIG_07496 [Fasciola gigantica]
MFDDNSMNLTSVEAKSASLLSALTTVAELKTNLNQLSQLVQSRNASNCDHDQSVSMQVDQCQEKNCSTSFMETTRNDSVDTFTSIDLETAARSVLNASSEVVRMLQKRRQSLSEAIEDVAVAITESELTRMEALENEMQFRSCDCDGNSSRHNHVLGTHDVSEVSPFNQTAVFELLERHVNYSVEEMERVSAEFKGEYARISYGLRVVEFHFHM